MTATAAGVVRVGVVGVGAIGSAHARSLSGTVAGAAVTVVCDADQERAAAVAAQVGARVARSLAEVLTADDVDAVLLASPDETHADQLLAGLPAGKPILCEKPLATTEEDARSVLDAEVAQGRRQVQVGFMRRFDPGYLALKREIGPGGIGDALIVHNIHRNTSAPYGLATERTLTNMVVHELDACRWLLDDEYSSVLVLAGRPGPHTPEGQHDPLLVVLESAGGVLVEVEAFANARLGYEVVCRVTGALGEAVMGDGAFITRSKAFSRGVDLPELWLGRFADAYRLQLQGWVDAVRAGHPPPGASSWDGYAATHAAERAVESYRTGRRVAVDLPARPRLYDGPAAYGDVTTPA